MYKIWVFISYLCSTLYTFVIDVTWVPCTDLTRFLWLGVCVALYVHLLHLCCILTPYDSYICIYIYWMMLVYRFHLSLLMRFMCGSVYPFIAWSLCTDYLSLNKRFTWVFVYTFIAWASCTNSRRVLRSDLCVALYIHLLHEHCVVIPLES